MRRRGSGRLGEVGERLERDEKKGGKFLNKATLHSELIMLAVLS